MNTSFFLFRPAGKILYREERMLFISNTGDSSLSTHFITLSLI